MCSTKQKKAMINYMDIFKLSPTRLRSSLLGKFQITLEISILVLRGIKSIHNKNVDRLKEENDYRHEISEIYIGRY